MCTDYNKAFKVGDRLILELGKEIFEGIYADGGRDRITLNEVVQYNPNNKKLVGLFDFYRSEISKIHRYKLPSSKEENRSEERESENSQNETNCRIVKVSEIEFYRLKELSRNFIFLENADNRYFKAVEVLSEAETVGVVALGMGNHRSDIIQLLALCTWQQVYIFDLANVKKRELYPELKQIFESEYVCKVIHKSAGLVDILFRHYNVYMQNIFDTQIVDLMLQKKETSVCPTNERDISECLEHYLHFPKSLLENALSVSNKKWKERPLCEKTKLCASQLVAYLLSLKDEFQKLLLKDVYDTISKVQDRVYDMDDFKFLRYNGRKEVTQEIQDLIPNLGKLNVEGTEKLATNSDKMENGKENGTPSGTHSDNYEM